MKITITVSFVVQQFEDPQEVSSELGFSPTSSAESGWRTDNFTTTNQSWSYRDETLSASSNSQIRELIQFLNLHASGVQSVAKRWKANIRINVTVIAGSASDEIDALESFEIPPDILGTLSRLGVGLRLVAIAGPAESTQS